MFSFIPKIEKENISLIIEIQSGLIRGALVKKENGQIKILEIITKIISKKNQGNSQYLTKIMLRKLTEILHLVGMHNRINSVHVVLLTPWVISHSQNVYKSFDNNTEINEKILFDTLDEEKNKLKENFNKQNKEIYDDLECIEEKIFNLKLNGYTVNNYKDKKSKELNMTFVISLCSKSIIEKINNTIHKNLVIENINYHSALLLSYLSLKSLLPDANEFVYIHVHGELTDLIIVKRGICVYMASFPIGTLTLIRKIENKLKQGEELVDSMVSLYIGKKLDDFEYKKIENIINSFEKDWLSLYEKTIELAKEKNVIPRLYIISGHSHIDIFKNILKNTSNQEIHTIDLNSENIDKYVKFSKNTEHHKLITMYAIALDNML